MKTREQKIKEAAARQTKRDGRTPEQQIELLKNRMGNSSKEIARLERLIAQKEVK